MPYPQTTHLTLSDIQTSLSNVNYNATLFIDEQALLKRSGFRFTSSKNTPTTGGKYWDNPLTYEYGNSIHTGGVNPLVEAMDIDWRPYAVRISTNPNDNEATSYSYIATTMDLMLTLTQKFAAIDATMGTLSTSSTVSALSDTVSQITYSYALTTTGGVVTLTGSNPGTSVTFTGDSTWTSVSGPANTNGNGTITISHIGPAVPATVGGANKYVSGVKFDAHGHATEIAYETIAYWTSTESNVITLKNHDETDASKTTFAAGTKINIATTGTEKNATITVSHTGNAVTAANGGTNMYVSGVLFDSTGHATDISYNTLPTYAYQLIRSAAANDTTHTDDGRFLNLKYTHGSTSAVAGSVDLQSLSVTNAVNATNAINVETSLAYVSGDTGGIQITAGNQISNALPISLTNTFAYPDNHTYNHSRYGLELKVGDTVAASIGYLYAKSSDSVTLHYPVSRTVDGDTHPVFNSNTKLYLPGVIPSTTLSPSYKDETDHWIYVSNGADGQSFPYILYTDSTYVLHTPNLDAPLTISYTSGNNGGITIKTNKGTDSTVLPMALSYVIAGDTAGLQLNVGSTLVDSVPFKLITDTTVTDVTQHKIGLRIDGLTAGEDITVPYATNATNLVNKPVVTYTTTTGLTVKAGEKTSDPVNFKIIDAGSNKIGLRIGNQTAGTDITVPYAETAGSASSADGTTITASYVTTGSSQGLQIKSGNGTADVVPFKLVKDTTQNTIGLRIDGLTAGEDIEFPTLSLGANNYSVGKYMAGAGVSGHTITHSYISLLSSTPSAENGKYVSGAEINSSGSIELTYTNLLNGNNDAANGKYVSKLEINSTGNIKATYTSLLDNSTSDGNELYISKLEINSTGNIKATYTHLPTIGDATLYIKDGQSTVVTYTLFNANAQVDNNFKIAGDGTWISTAIDKPNGVMTISHIGPDTTNTSTKSASTGKYISGVTVDGKGHVTAVTDAALPTLSVASNQRTNGQYMADTSVSGHTITNSYINLLNGNNDAANTKYISKLEINSTGNIKASYTTLLDASNTNGTVNHAGYIANIVNDSGTLKATYGSFAPSITHETAATDGHPMVKITVAGCDSETDTIKFSSYTAAVYSKSGIPQYQGVTPSSEWDDIFNQHVDGNDSLLVSALNDTRINKGVSYIGAWNQANNHHLYIDPVSKSMQGNIWVDFVKNAPFILNTDTSVKYLFAPSIVTTNIYGIATEAIKLSSNPEISYVSGNSGGIKITAGTKQSTALPVSLSYASNANGITLTVGTTAATYVPVDFSYVANKGALLTVGGKVFTIPFKLSNGGSTVDNQVKLTIGSQTVNTVTINNVSNATNAALADKVMVAQIEAGKKYNLVGPTSDEIGGSGASLRGHTTYLLFDCSSDVNRLKPIFRIGCDTTCGKLDTSGAITCASGGVTITAGGLTVSAGGATISAGGLTVSGNSTFNNNLTVKGDTNLGDANSDTTTIKGNLIVGGTTYGPKVSSGASYWSFWNTYGTTYSCADIIEHGHAVVSPDPTPLVPLGGTQAISGERIKYIETRSTVPAAPNANTMYVLI